MDYAEHVDARISAARMAEHAAEWDRHRYLMISHIGREWARGDVDTLTACERLCSHMDVDGVELAQLLSAVALEHVRTVNDAVACEQQRLTMTVNVDVL
jgi:hypothetical protein